jgi:KUP system potassium uptake protein
LTEDTPRVDDKERASIERISKGFSRATLPFGFMETPNVPRALAALRLQGLKFDVMRTSFFLSRRTLRPASKSKMPKWQDHLFISLSRSADDASKYFHIPEGRAVEVGAQITV